jgi:hypothetical protein
MATTDKPAKKTAAKKPALKKTMAAKKPAAKKTTAAKKVTAPKKATRLRHMALSRDGGGGGFAALPGRMGRVRRLRYRCPRCEYERTFRMVPDQIPKCPTHRVTLKAVD